MTCAPGRLAAPLAIAIGVAAAAATSAMAPPRSAALDEGNSNRQQGGPSAQRRAVADWSRIAQNVIVAVGRKFPGEAAVYMGIVHAAIYDVVVAIEAGAVRPGPPFGVPAAVQVALLTGHVLRGRRLAVDGDRPGEPGARVR